MRGTDILEDIEVITGGKVYSVDVEVCWHYRASSRSEPEESGFDFDIIHAFNLTDEDELGADEFYKITDAVEQAIKDKNY